MVARRECGVVWYVSHNGTHKRLGKAAVFRISERRQSNKGLSSQKDSPTHFE